MVVIGVLYLDNGGVEKLNVNNLISRVFAILIYEY